MPSIRANQYPSSAPILGGVLQRGGGRPSACHQSACHHQHAIISMRSSACPSSACHHPHACMHLLQGGWLGGPLAIRGHQRSSEGHACMHLLQGGWLGGPLAAFPRHVAPPGQRGARVHIRQPTRVHIRQPTRVVLSRRGRVHSGMLFSGADGSEGDENLAEVVLAHLMREAIHEDEGGNQRINQCQSIAPRSAHSFAIALNRNPSQSHSIHRTPSHLPRTHALRFEIVQSRALKRDRTSPARTPCGSSRERSRAAST